MWTAKKSVSALMKLHSASDLAWEKKAHWNVFETMIRKAMKCYCIEPSSWNRLDWMVAPFVGRKNRQCRWWAFYFFSRTGVWHSFEQGHWLEFSPLRCKREKVIGVIWLWIWIYKRLHNRWRWNQKWQQRAQVQLALGCMSFLPWYLSSMSVKPALRRYPGRLWSRYGKPR